MQIHGLNKTTLLDYPGHVAATIFTGGCNFRCPFCHNGDLVLHPGSYPVISEEEIFAFLKKRKGVLSGVCITGGEPALQADLDTFVKKIKDLGYLVKLDTNGYRPDVLEKLLAEELLDYVAMDIKHCREKYELATGVSEIDIALIEKSVELLKQSSIDYEFRTTVVRELHASEDFLTIGQWLAGAKAYYLQTYRDNENVIRREFTPYEREDMEKFVRLLTPFVKKAALRGME